MAKRQQSQARRGVPRRAANPSRKAKYADYRKRSTCWCGSVFRSPKKMNEHMLMSHPN